jgi:flagellar basal-body rod modification protein FlgD
MTTSAINPLQNIPGGLTPPADTPVTTPSSGVDQAGFLKLLVAQLQNQDPLSPMDNEQFVQQLTSFSSLDELRNINKGLSGLNQLGDISKLLGAGLALQQTNVNAMAVGLIGKRVEAASDTVQIGGTGGSEISFALPDTGASQVTVSFEDASGQKIYESTFDPAHPPTGVRLEGGRVYVQVPTQAPDGAALPQGPTKIKVEASGSGGSTTLDTTIIGQVQGIDFRGDKTLLSIGGTQVDITNVLAVNSGS